jgi:hypothetical protein
MCELLKINLNTVKILYFVGTNFRGFYKKQWSMGSWIHDITDNNEWESCISLDFYFHGLSEPQNQRKLEPHD